MYVPGGEDWWKRKLEPAEFANATRATRYLVAEATASGAFDRADYLNVNAPIANPDGERDTPAPMRVTAPSTWYGMEAAHDGNGRVSFSDPIWGKK